jgi:hypothetical protein
VDLKAVPARATLALGHLGDQEHLLESDRNGLEFAEAPAFSTDFPAFTPGTNQQLCLDQQNESDTAGGILSPPVLVSFTNAKRMVQKALDHAPSLP